MAAKSKPETKTVTRYSATHGTKVTVSEDTAKRLGSGFTETEPKSSGSTSRTTSK